MRTIHMEFDPCSRKGRLPAYFARVFGVQVAPFVVLRDPNCNEIEVAVEKRNDKVYFTDGWPFLRNYLGDCHRCKPTLFSHGDKLFARC